MSFVIIINSIYLIFIILGKGESLWDLISHMGAIKNKDTGDIAADSYHKYKEDVKLLSDLKVI